MNYPCWHGTSAGARVLACCLCLAACPTACGVIVHGTQGNTIAPPDDPGWNHVTETGSSMVYLGDAWMLTAAHSVNVRNLSSVDLPVGTFDVIPNTQVTLHNPPGLGLSTETDLQMFRINGNPNLPVLKISATPPPVNAQVTMIGRGNNRLDDLTHWQANTSSNPWTWSEVPAGGTHFGYKTAGSQRTKRWGTNRIVSDNAVTGENDPDNTTVTDVRGRDVINLLTKFDTTGTQFEAQAAGGDSGGAVFYRRSGQWELTGIMNSVFVFNGQRTDWSVFGNSTGFADLSTYRDQILDLMGQPNYSVMGDINLDGKVSGDGTGPADSDDLAAFVSGWRHAQSVPNIDSWKRGDLNQDAVTNFQDFLLLRSALGTNITLSDALAGRAVPEPGSWLLAAAAAAAVAWWWSRRS